LGTRLLPLTRSVPKELLPVGRFPMIQWCVAEAALAGIEEIILVIRQGKEAIMSYFLDELDEPLPPAGLWGHLDFRFLYQEKPRGPGDALLEASSVIGDEPFALLFPDDIFLGGRSALSQLVSLFERTGEMVTGLIQVGSQEGRHFGNCGRVDVDPADDLDGEGVYRIKKLYDKGIGHFEVRGKGEVRWTGRHVLLPSFLHYLQELDREAEYLDDVSAFQQKIDEAGMLGKLIECEVFDVGNMKGYLRANAVLAGRDGLDYLSLKI